MRSIRLKTGLRGVFTPPTSATYVLLHRRKSTPSWPDAPPDTNKQRTIAGDYVEAAEC